jgi:hypothetical protein
MKIKHKKCHNNNKNRKSNPKNWNFFNCYCEKNNQKKDKNWSFISKKVRKVRKIIVAYWFIKLNFETKKNFHSNARFELKFMLFFLSTLKKRIWRRIWKKLENWIFQLDRPGVFFMIVKYKKKNVCCLLFFFLFYAILCLVIFIGLVFF